MENDNILLTSEDYIKTMTSLSDNLEGKSLLPSIKLAQDIELQQTTGTKLYRKLQDMVADGSISSSENPNNKVYKELLDRYIQPFLAYQVTAYLIFEIGFKAVNQGVIETFDENISNLRLAERNAVRQQYQHYADHYRIQMQNFIRKNISKLPEATDCDEYNNKADLKTAFSTGLFLGGPRGKKLNY